MVGPVNWARFHLWATGVWALLLVPTLLWWLDSLVWVVIMSWYAIVVGHWGAYQAARVEENANATNDQGTKDGRVSPGT